MNGTIEEREQWRNALLKEFTNELRDRIMDMRHALYLANEGLVPQKTCVEEVDAQVWMLVEKARSK